MNLTSGKTTLSIVLSSLKEHIEGTLEYKNYQHSVACTKMINGFYEKLLLSPMVFYVPQKTIAENKIDDDFEKYTEDIFYVEKIYDLLLCMNLSPLEQDKFRVTWIICEMTLNVQKTRAFHDVTFLDYYLEKEEGKQNTSGRLDYELMDVLFLQQFKKTDLKKFLKTPRKFFYTAIFKVTTAKKKGQYAKQELRYTPSPNTIDVTKKDITLKYNYNCPICDSQHLVYLNGHKNKNVNKYLRLNGKNVEFLCGHEGTDYSGMVNFSFDAEQKGFILHTDMQYNQAFLHLFYLARHNQGKIVYCKSETEEASLSVAKFHALRTQYD